MLFFSKVKVSLTKLFWNWIFPFFGVYKLCNFALKIKFIKLFRWSTNKIHVSNSIHIWISKYKNWFVIRHVFTHPNIFVRRLTIGKYLGSYLHPSVKRIKNRLRHGLQNRTPNPRYSWCYGMLLTLPCYSRTCQFFATLLLAVQWVNSQFSAWKEIA